MSECYKCGQSLPEGQVECAGGCDGFALPTRFDDEECEREFKAAYMEVDWDQVKTLEDVIAIMRAQNEMFVRKDSPNFEQLTKFLKPIE